MKEITLKIPDDKIDFYMELFERLGLQIQEDFDIPDAHIELVRERIRNSKEENLISWTEARKTLKFKNKKDAF